MKKSLFSFALAFLMSMLLFCGSASAASDANVKLCNDYYNAYQSIKYMRTKENASSGVQLSVIDNEIRQIDIGCGCKSTAYFPSGKYEIIYYYRDGLPYFSLMTDLSTKQELRVWMMNGKTLQWKDSSGYHYDSPWVYDIDLSIIYDRALLVYARAMYDSGRYAEYVVQVGAYSAETALRKAEREFQSEYPGCDYKLYIYEDRYLLCIAAYGNDFVEASDDADILNAGCFPGALVRVLDPDEFSSSSGHASGNSAPSGGGSSTPTATQVRCDKCYGGNCPSCGGAGYKPCQRNSCIGGKCSFCGGTGRNLRTNKPCTVCSFGNCTTCGGDGRIECRRCGGSGDCTYCSGLGFTIVYK